MLKGLFSESNMSHVIASSRITFVAEFVQGILKHVLPRFN